MKSEKENSKTGSSVILTINGGSSSIKFAVFSAASPPVRAFAGPSTPSPGTLGEGGGEGLHVSPPVRVFSGQVERIGDPGARLTAKGDDFSDTQPIKAATFHDGAQNILDYLRKRLGNSPIGGIGHRIVHGGLKLLEHQLITDQLIAELRAAQPLDLMHLPREIALIDSFRKAYPDLPQVACFDTAFHRDMPRVAQLLPIPRRYFEAGVRRFGFHGLSYTYLMSRLAVVAGPQAADGRVIFAHLGSGASMAAVHHGKPIDTTMAFTPTAGLVMGTRPGDSDPGLLVYLMRQEKMSPDDMDKFISEQCGLLGLSETSADMRDLTSRRAADPRAADAVDVFCYQARKFIGAFSAALGGLETLVFSGGIGEHAPEIRAGICAGLEYLGIKIDAGRNAEDRDVISPDESRVTVRVIPTDEEIVIAKTVLRFVN